MIQPIKELLVSKGVIFEEEKKWKWDKEFDSDNDNDSVVHGEEEAEPEGFAPEEPAPAIQDSNVPASKGKERRNVRKPAWMHDYVNLDEALGNIVQLSTDDMLMMTLTKDGAYYEEASKDPKWRAAMD